MRTLTSTVTVLERPDLATLRLGGNDVLRYLHAVCTQHTLDLAPGDATQALLLSPKGRIEFAFRLAVLEGGVLVDTEADAAAGLAERLARFVFRYDVTVGQPVTGAASLLGAGTEAALAAAGLPVPGPGQGDRGQVGPVDGAGQRGHVPMVAILVCGPDPAMANWQYARREVVQLSEPVRTREVTAR